MRLLSHRLTFLIGFIAILFCLGFAAFLQTYRGVNPCPLCILQRLTLGLLGVTFLLGILFSVKRLGQISFGLLGFIFALLGALLSGRQVWLQHFQINIGANCDVSLQYMLQAMPFNQVLEKIFEGGSACSQVDWRFLSLSLAEWSLLSFVLLMIFSLCQLRKP